MESVKKAFALVIPHLSNVVTSAGYVDTRKLTQLNTCCMRSSAALGNNLGVVALGIADCTI